MESIALFGGGSLSKLPFYEPSSAIPKLASTSRLCFNLRKPFLIPQLISTSHGFTWNPNVRDKFLARCCGNEHTGKTRSNEIQDALKSLLSLTPSQEKNSAISARKNAALKKALEGKYDEALCHMKHLFNGDAHVAYEARVAHLQILIRLDEYNKALEFLEETGNFRQSNPYDARLSLCEAVVHTMLGNDGKAKTLWKTYLDIDNDNGNEMSHGFMKNAKTLLKPLLSLKKAFQVKNVLNSNIIPAKKRAMEALLDGHYDAAECCMKVLCNQENSEMDIEAKLAYIQILIYLDKYEDARNRVSEIEKQTPFPLSDATPYLYKAIGLTALGKHDEEAKKNWKMFMKTIDGNIFDPTEFESQ